MGDGLGHVYSSGAAVVLAAIEIGEFRAFQAA
jgi:hypothetical protein